jgi:hypothetical protein
MRRIGRDAIKKYDKTTIIDFGNYIPVVGL